MRPPSERQETPPCSRRSLFSRTTRFGPKSPRDQASERTGARNPGQGDLDVFRRLSPLPDSTSCAFSSTPASHGHVSPPAAPTPPPHHGANRPAGRTDALCTSLPFGKTRREHTPVSRRTPVHRPVGHVHVSKTLPHAHRTHPVRPAMDDLPGNASPVPHAPGLTAHHPRSRRMSHT